MKNGWPTKSLGEVCQIKPPKSEARDRISAAELVSFLPMEDVGIGEKFVSATQEKSLSAVAGSYTYFADGDVLLAKITPCFENGKLAIAEKLTNGIGFGSSEYIVFRPNRTLSNEWLYYYLSRETFRAEGAARMTGAVGHKRVPKEFIESYPIPVPPLPEQQRIIGTLDEAFARIATVKANTEKNLRNARALLESHLQSVFTQRGAEWQQKTLEEIAITFGRGKSKHRPRNDKRLYGGKYPFIQTGDIRSAEHFITDYSQTYSETGLAQSKLWPKGTICITIAANIAETGILAFDACFPDSVIGIVANPEFADVGFVEYLLQSFKVRLQAEGKGSAQANINMGTFENQRFPFPSLAEQKRIVTKLDSLREETKRLESIYRHKLTSLEALKKSLLHQAFEGELTAQTRKSVVIPFSTRIPNITTTDLHAGILAIAYELHEKNQKQSYFGHIKAEKIAHMIEAHLGIDLERNPIKDAAGPNDYPHLKRVEHRAKKAGFFLFQESEGAGYRITKYRGFDGLIDRTRLALGDRNSDIDAFLQFMLPLKTKQAEILATVYAAWNNLLLDNGTITDEAIVLEARENWHPDKLKIKRSRFFDAIKSMTERGVIPTGKGKKVNAKLTKKR